MKLHEEFKLYETLWESLNTTAVVFVGDKRNEKALLNKAAKANPAQTTTVYSASDFLRQYQNANKEQVKFYTDARGKADLEKACADMPDNMKKKILSTTALLEWKAMNGSNANTTSNSQPTTTAAQPNLNLTWEDLLAHADKLLDELVCITDNIDNDDGDGYWQSEYDTWCFRYLYHKATLNNTAKLAKLCADYSKKLPNVKFYFDEDRDIGASEIGYIATREDEDE